MKRRVKVTTAHRNVAAEALLRAMKDDESWHCEHCYRAAIDEVAQMLAEGKTVMLRKDGDSRMKLFSR